MRGWLIVVTSIVVIKSKLFATDVQKARKVQIGAVPFKQLVLVLLADQKVKEQMQEFDEWHFDFGLCSSDARLIPATKCDELLDVIIDWAEKNGYGIGGGFRPFTDLDQ